MSDTKDTNVVTHKIEIGKNVKHVLYVALAFIALIVCAMALDGIVMLGLVLVIAAIAAGIGVYYFYRYKNAEGFAIFWFAVVLLSFFSAAFKEIFSRMPMS